MEDVNVMDKAIASIRETMRKHGFPDVRIDNGLDAEFSNPTIMLFGESFIAPMAKLHFHPVMKQYSCGSSARTEIYNGIPTHVTTLRFCPLDAEDMKNDLEKKLTEMWIAIDIMLDGFFRENS